MKQFFLVVLSLAMVLDSTSQTGFAADPAKKAALSTARQFLSKKGLSATPNTATVAKAKKKTASTKSFSTNSKFGASFSGTPPNLVDIPTEDLVSLFYPGGEIAELASGSPSEEACHNFWGSETAGESGGFNACYMTEGVGFAFQNMLSSGASVCYMSKFPNVPEASTLVSGSYPEGGLKAIFAPPAGTVNRVVRVTPSGGQQLNAQDDEQERILITIYAKGNNAPDKVTYAHQLAFCVGTDDHPSEIESLEIKNNGQYFAHTLGRKGGGQSETTIRAFVTSLANKVVFDTTKTRTAEVTSIHDDGSFKGELEITPGNLMKNKTMDSHEDGTRKAYSVSRFSGNGLDTLKFLEGGSKDEQHSGIVEYKNDGYYTASIQTISNLLEEVDVASDPFYSTTPAVDDSLLDTIDCNATPDVDIELDMSDPGMTEVAASCEGANHIEGMDFCRSSTLHEAVQNWFDHCAP